MNIRKLDIQSFTSKHLHQMVELERNCGLEPYSAEMLVDCVASLHTFACFDGGKIIGFVTVNSRSRMMNGNIYIVNINISERYRGKGIAKRLLLYVYDYYASENIKWVTLDVAKDNTAMVLYRKIGFIRQDTPSRNGDTDVVMAIPFEMMGQNLRRLI